MDEEGNHELARLSKKSEKKCQRHRDQNDGSDCSLNRDGVYSKMSMMEKLLNKTIKKVDKLSTRNKDLKSELSLMKSSSKYLHKKVRNLEKKLGKEKKNNNRRNGESGLGPRDKEKIKKKGIRAKEGSINNYANKSLTSSSSEYSDSISSESSEDSNTFDNFQGEDSYSDEREEKNNNNRDIPPSFNTQDLKAEYLNNFDKRKSPWPFHQVTKIEAVKRNAIFEYSGENNGSMIDLDQEFKKKEQQQNQEISKEIIRGYFENNGMEMDRNSDAYLDYDIEQQERRNQLGQEVIVKDEPVEKWVDEFGDLQALDNCKLEKLQLVFPYRKYSKEGFDRISEKIIKMVNLKEVHLDLRKNTMESEGRERSNFKHLAETLLANLKKVRVLHLNFSDMHIGKNLPIICDGLLRISNLTHLSMDLSTNYIGKNGVQALVDKVIVPCKSTLRVLDLNFYSNRLFPRGVSILGEGVLQLKKLVTLKLNIEVNNILSDSYIFLIRNSLSQLRQLTVVQINSHQYYQSTYINIYLNRVVPQRRRLLNFFWVFHKKVKIFKRNAIRMEIYDDFLKI